VERLSLSAGELHVGASAGQLDDQLGSGLLVEEEILAGSARGDLPKMLFSVLDGGC
jgi:hypothetical protein